MRSTRHARALIALLVATASASFAATPNRPEDLRADSLYEAGAYDSLVTFSSRQIEMAAARHDSVALGRMLLFRGRARYMLRLAGAEADFDAALAVSTAARDSLNWASALGFQSLMAVINGRFDESIRLNERRLAIARAVGSDRNVGWAHLLSGYAYLMQGRLELAEIRYRDAVAAFERAGRPRDALEALIGLGRVHNSAGRTAQARVAYREALELARSLGDARQEADCWNNLGGLELERGDLALAAGYFRRSYALKLADHSYDVASPAIGIALANTIIGRYAAAESVLVDAVAAAREWRFELLFNEIYVTVGRLRLAQGRPRGAAVYFRRALARGDTGTVEARLDAAAGLAEALARQDSASAALDALDEYVPDATRAPPSSARAGVLLLRARCERVSGRPELAVSSARAALTDATTRDDPRDGVLAALALSAAEHARGDPEAAFRWFDQARLIFAGASARSGEYQWREAFRTSLVPQLVAGAGVVLDWPPAAPRAEKERALFDVLQEVRARTLMERITDPRRQPDEDPAGMVTASELQETVLRDGECLLDISTGPGVIFVFAVTRDSLRLRVVDDRDGSLEKRGRRYAGLAGTPAGTGALPRAAPVELLAGANDLLMRASSVVVVCDGWVSSLPVGALPLDGGAPLIERRGVSVVPAASQLRDERAHRGEPARRVLALAPAGAALPGARREVRFLAERYAGVRVVDSAVTADSIPGWMADRGVIHVASHVRVNGERPWNSSIQLGPDGPETACVRASEIARSDYRGRLVVLSGCESALGRETQGEGVLGITTAFLAAGARAVVASLWKVDDRTTEELMLAFYRGLESGLDAGSALRAAQLEVRDRKPAPFYWAGFVVVGDATARVALERRPQSRIHMVLLSLAIVGLAAAAAAGYRRRRL